MVSLSLFLTYCSFLWFGCSNGNSNNDIIGWRQEPQSGDIPGVSSGSTMVSDGRKYLYLLLGFVECFKPTVCDNEYYNISTVYQYSIRSNAWTKLIPVNIANNKTVPPERVFFDAAYIPSNKPCSSCPKNSIVLYGGTIYNAQFTQLDFYDDFWYYDIDKNEWFEIIPISSTKPDKLSGAQLIIDGDLVYLFGGINNAFSVTNKFYKYSFVTNTWTEILPNGVIPSPRYIFAFERHQNTMYLRGGNLSPGTSIDDFWIYDINSNTWQGFGGTNNPNKTGIAHFGGAYDRKANKYYLFFGDTTVDALECITEGVNAAHAVSNHTWQYDIDNDQWRLLEFGKNNGLNIVSKPLKRVAYATIKSKVYVATGFDHVCDEPQTVGFEIFNQALLSLDMKNIPNINGQSFAVDTNNNSFVSDPNTNTSMFIIIIIALVAMVIVLIIISSILGYKYYYQKNTKVVENIAKNIVKDEKNIDIDINTLDIPKNEVGKHVNAASTDVVLQ